MTFRFTYDPRECFRAIRLAQRLRRRTPSWLFALPCLIALGWLAAEPRGAEAAGVMLPTVSWIAVLLFLVYGLVPLATLYAAYRVRKRDPALAGERTCTLTDAGLAVRAQGASADFAWSHFARGVETREMFLLLPRVGGMYYLPKRALASETDVRAARGMLTTHLGRSFQPLADT